MFAAAIVLILIIVGIGLMTLEGIIRFAGVILIVAGAVMISRYVMKAINSIVFDDTEDFDTKEKQRALRYLTTSIMALLPTGVLHLIWFQSVSFSNQQVTPVIDRAGGMIVVLGYGTFAVFLALAVKTFKENRDYKRWKVKQEARKDNT